MSSTTRWRISPVGWTIIAFAVTVESASNALRGYALGSHMEGFNIPLDAIGFEGATVNLAGALIVMAAIVVSLSQTQTTFVALTPGDRTHRFICACVAALCITISITAMSSHLQDMQRIKDGAEQQDSTAYVTAKAAYDAAKADFDRVKDSASLAEVDAQIAAAGARIDQNIWRRSAQCTDVTKASTQRECRPVLDLIPLRGIAKTKSELAASLSGLKADMERHKLKGEASVAEKATSRTWGWIMGLGIVLIATFGKVIFAKPVSVPAPEAVPTMQPSIMPANDYRFPPFPTNPPPFPPGGGKRGRKINANVTQFSEQFRARHGRYPAGSDIRAAFPELPQSTAYDYAARARQLTA